MISFFSNLSIGRKLNVVLVLTSLIAMVAMGVALWQFQSNTYETNLEANVISTARIIADNSASSIIFDDEETAAEILSSLDNIPGFSSAMLHGEDKAVLATRGLDSPEAEAEFMDAWITGYKKKIEDGSQGFVVFGDGFVFVDQPIIYDGQDIGDLHMIFSLESLAAQRLKLGRFMVLVFTGALGLVFLVGHRLQGLISRPLIELARTAALVSKEKNYALRVEVTSRDETGQLTDSFNKMLTTIQGHEKSLVESIREADRASQAKGQFLANMSHEIRTPMNGIIGMAELLMDSKMTVDQRDNLDVIQHSAEQLLSIINEILDFSKVESGNLDLETDAFDLPRVVVGVAKMMAPTATRKGLKIQAVIDEKAPGRVLGDPVRLRQILVNMASNAVKFTSSGEVEIRVHQLSVSGDSARLRFEVVDQGIGIPADQQGKIFSQFTQVDDSNTRSYGGTGLGLAICKLLVELMGGRIGVQSTEGEGSTFWFEIEMPVLAEQAPGQDELSPAESQKQPAVENLVLEKQDRYPKSRILLVEDNKTNQLVISKTLIRLGCQVDISENGKEGVAQLRDAKEPYDLVFMDCQMPVMDGYKATGIIRSLPGRVSRTTIIALTASAMPEDRGKALAAKMDDYLSKPVKIFALKAALTKWVWAPNEAAQKLIEKEKEEEKTQVLVAEDNPTNQMVVCRLLKKLGCEIKVADDGEKAVECVMSAARPFDIIFMDCHMPNMDGYDATRSIRKLSGPKAQVPIIALTAASSQEDIDRSLESGMNAHLTKPARKKALQEAIEQWAGVDSELIPS